MNKIISKSARAISKILFILGSYKALAYLPGMHQKLRLVFWPFRFRSRSKQCGNFSVRTLGYFLKRLKLFFDLENIKKNTPKSCILWQLGVFFLCSTDCPKQPRASFPFYIFFYPSISCRISDPNIPFC